MSNRITETIEEGIADEVFPGAVLLVAYRGRICFHKAFGLAVIQPKRTEMTCGTLFDIASLTKPLATAAATAFLLQKKVLTLEDPIGKYIPAYVSGEKFRVTLFHLLNHSAGLPDWKPYYEEIVQRDIEEKGFLGSQDAKTAIYQMAEEEALIASAGEKSCYSDIGFILLGKIIEKITSMPLDQFCEENIFSRCESDAPFFIPIKDSKPNLFDRSVAATENLAWRNGVVRGIVHDDNAYVMGGVAGHAGLFSTATGVYKLICAWLDSIKGAGHLDREIARLFVTRQGGEHLPKGASWGLGWDTPSCPIKAKGSAISSSGHYFSADSFGHLGYTGTSIWVDRKHDLIVILLTNRVHPSHENNKIRHFRPELHDIIFKEIVDG